MKVSEHGENALIRLLVKGMGTGAGVLVGPGDDCAVVECCGASQHGDVQLLKTDCVIEGIHYAPGLEPQRVGRKAICRVLSDMAAMGGEGRHALVTVMTPPDRSVDYWRGVYRGLGRVARRFGVEVVGGETSASRHAAISIAMAGCARRGKVVLRSGGKAGDVLFVTGRLGGSLARKHWAFEPRIAQGLWLAAEGRASAMMDLSDGLGADLPRLAKASGCGYEVEESAVPRSPGCSVKQALGDGEDYELLVAVPQEKARFVERAWKQKFPRLALTRIGHLLESPTTRPLSVGGFCHF